MALDTFGRARAIALPAPSRRAAALGGVVLLALLVRLPLFPFESDDYRRFLGPWYRHIVDVGFAEAMSERFADYSPPYLYLLGALVEFDIPALAGIKLISVAFDFLLAAAVYAIVRTMRPGPIVAPAAAAAVLFAPTVVMNSALWGQCDAIYTTFLAGTLALILRDRPWWAMVCFGAAFAFKVQAVFFLPALLAFTLRGRVPLLAWLLVPVVYLAAIVPSWLLGRPLWELVTLYQSQAEQYSQLSLNAPNFYQWLPAWSPLRTIGIWGAGAASLAFALAAARPGRPLDHRRMLAIAVASLLLVPFLLPHMHDRYWYPADVLTIAYAFAVPRRWYLPVIVVGCSALAYLPFLFHLEPVPMGVPAAGMAFALAVALRDAILGPPGDVAADEDGAVGRVGEGVVAK